MSSISSHVACELAVPSADCFSTPALVETTSKIETACARTDNDEPPMELARAAGGVAMISYNRPMKNNSFDAAVSCALIMMLGNLDKDETTSSVVLTGRGTYFCAAAKFDEMLRPAHLSELASSISLGTAEVFASFLGFSKPIIAAVNGPALGGGVTQATLCDMSVSA